MKRVFSLTAVFMAVLFISSCTPFSTIPKVEFTFVNQSSVTAVVTPDSSEDWSGLTILTSETKSILSENSTILFTATLDGTVVYLNQGNFTYDSSTRTYKFKD